MLRSPDRPRPGRAVPRAGTRFATVRVVGVILAVLVLAAGSACAPEVPQIGGEEGSWCGLHLAEVMVAAQDLGISLEDDSGAINMAEWNRACRAAYQWSHG